MAVSEVIAGAQAFSAPGGDVGVLLLHGFTGNPVSLRPLARTLAAQGLAVELPLLPGAGTHWRDLQATRWQDWAGAAGAALYQLRGRARTTVVVGLSAGGTLALHLAATRPADVDGLVLINPALVPRGRRLAALGVLQWVLPAVRGVGNDIALPGGDERAYDRVPLRAYASLVALQRLVTGELGRVVAPALVLTSRHDHVVNPGDSARVLDGLGSLDVEQVWLERSYHVATLDHDAELIAQRVAAFIRQVVG